MGKYRSQSVGPSDKQIETRREKRAEKHKIRRGLVYATKCGIINGNYETPEKVAVTVDRLLDHLDLR